MLAVSLKDSVAVKYDSDYIKLSVGKSVNNFPTKKMFSVGDVICFDSPLASTSNWASSNNNIVRVEGHLGNSIYYTLLLNKQRQLNCQSTHPYIHNAHIYYRYRICNRQWDLEY